MKQANLFEHFKRKDLKRRYSRISHGGVESGGRRKLERPLARNKPVHLTLKSSKATGTWSFLHPKNRIRIEQLLKAKAKKFGIKIQDFANVGNHLHIKLKFQSRENFQNFLRACTCQISRMITGARRGNKIGKFWDALAYTRILKSNFEERVLKGYFHANRIEAGKGHSARQAFLDKFNDWIRRPNNTPIFIEPKNPHRRLKHPPGSIKFGDVVVPPGKWTLIN